MRIAAKAFAHRGDDAPDGGVIFRRVGAEMAAVAKVDLAPVCEGGEDIRVGIDQPGRGGSGGRAEHADDPGFCKLGDGALQPIEGEASLFGLEG